MATFNHTAIYNRHCIAKCRHVRTRKRLKTSKRLIKLLSACNNNNSLHKLENKFYMWAGYQKLRYNLEWPNSYYTIVNRLHLRAFKHSLSARLKTEVVSKVNIIK